MKKTYFAPETTVVNVEIHHIMEGSETLGISDETIEDASLAESRRHSSVWDDEDDYDD